MSKLFIPTEILEKMVCLSCKHYLSVFPVYTKNDSSGAICGRCKVTDEENFIKDEAYEGIAQFLLFPCMHSTNGCEESLVPIKLDDHEKCCKFRKFECPSRSYSKCQWSGPQTDLLDHFKSMHENLLLTDSKFEFNFLSSQREKMLLYEDFELFIVNKEVDSRKQVFMCSVLHLKSDEEEEEEYQYFLKVQSADKNYFHKCSERSTREEDFTKLDAEFLANELNDPDSFIVTIGILRETSSRIEVLEKAKVSDDQKNENINWELLSDLECPMCFKYMLPPIYQCLNGHSICKQCKIKYIKCPVCHGNMADTQNFTLERLTQHLDYPCENHASGCKYYGKSTDIEEHESSCDLGPYDCPMKEQLGCDWNSKKSGYMEHIEDKHADSILKAERVDVPFKKDEPNEKIFFVKFFKNYFNLLYKYANEKFYWEVQTAGQSDFSKNHRFEVDIIDLSGNKRRCYLMGLVSPLVGRSRRFEDPSRYVVASLEQVESCIVNIISFRIRIISDDTLV